MKKLIPVLQRTFPVIVGLLAFYNCTQAQNSVSFERDFTRYKRINLTEKIYAHTDKNFYVTGELLWFKLYAVDGSNKPFGLSKVAYVDVLDANRNAVMQGKIALNEGSGNGSFYVPLTLTNGNYRLRAYTSWMKNIGPEAYFEKVITIVNPLKAPDISPGKAVASAYDVQFFPEGGDLVKGLTSKVAFKITGADGKGAALKGAVINQQNDTIVRFSPLKFGMGTFMFTPVAGNTYRAVIQIPGGRPLYKNLPVTKNEGYVLQVADASNVLNISVKSNTGTPTAYCITYSGERVADAQTLGSGNNQFTIAKSKLAEGANHITVFNSNRQPVAERLYFKRPAAKPLAVNATTGQQQYGMRRPVNLNITTADASRATAANLSVAVYRADSLQKGDVASIYNYLWLGAELKGSIEMPDYYFSAADRQTDEALDNLMLTQGWRRFNWEQVLNTAYKPAYLPEYTGHLITGRLTDSVTNKPTPGITAYLSAPGKYADLYAAQSDSAGKLLFEPRNFYGPKEIILQTNTRQDSTYKIELQSPFDERVTERPMPALQLNPVAETDLKNYNLSMQLQNVYAGDKLRRYYSPGIDSVSFYVKPYKSYQLEDFTRFTTMEEVLREYVTDISVTSRQRHFHIRTIDQNSYLQDEPLVMLDGIPIFNIDRTFALDPLKVKKLEVIRNRYFYGPTAFEGILSFTTYKGDLGGFEIDPHAVILDYEGMQLQREFYSPVYGTTQQLNSRLPDFRNVLYWEPNAGTNAQGKSTLQFYTSDLPGRYIISIEGITPNGDAGSKVLYFEVKK
jgi:hypothetical protein